MLCAGTKNTILLSIRIMEKKPFKGAEITEEKFHTKAQEKCHTSGWGIQKMPYHRPEEFGKNAML